MSDDHPAFLIRPLEKTDRNWVAHFLDEHWSSTKIVTRGQVYYGHLLPGLVAYTQDESAGSGEKVAGLLTYRIDEGDHSCEIMTLNSLQANHGVGTALVEALRGLAQEQGVRRLWLITTNDNLEALRFWQKRGFVLCALYPDALIEARRHKPQIPIIGKDGIPLRDEIELELRL